MILVDRIVPPNTNGYEKYMLCKDCKYLNTDSVNKEKHPKCKAFPDGIPRDVWKGHISHEQEIKGDHGIQFKDLTEDFESLSKEEQVEVTRQLLVERLFSVYDIYNE